MTREALEEVDTFHKAAENFYYGTRRTTGGGKKLRLKIESFRAAIHRKVKQRQQKKARMLNKRK